MKHFYSSLFFGIFTVAAMRAQQQLPPPTIATLFPNVKVDRGNVSKYLIPWDKWDFGPRIGLAYQLTGKTEAREAQS